MTDPPKSERDDLVRQFAYEFVRFNHDPTRAYLVTDVTDDCMLELEGMPGLFAPHLFQRVTKTELSRMTITVDGLQPLGKTRQRNAAARKEQP